MDLASLIFPVIICRSSEFQKIAAHLCSFHSISREKYKTSSFNLSLTLVLILKRSVGSYLPLEGGRSQFVDLWEDMLYLPR